MRQPRSRAMPQGARGLGVEGDHDVVAARPPARPAARATRPRAVRPSAGSARLPTITGCTNSTATWRTSDRACGEQPKRQQAPAAGEALGQRWQSVAVRSACVREEAAVGRRAPRASSSMCASAPCAPALTSDLPWACSPLPRVRRTVRRTNGGRERWRTRKPPQAASRCRRVREKRASDRRRAGSMARTTRPSRRAARAPGERPKRARSRARPRSRAAATPPGRRPTACPRRERSTRIPTRRPGPPRLSLTRRARSAPVPGGKAVAGRRQASRGSPQRPRRCGR